MQAGYSEPKLAPVWLQSETKTKQPDTAPTLATGPSSHRSCMHVCMQQGTSIPTLNLPHLARVRPRWIDYKLPQMSPEHHHDGLACIRTHTCLHWQPPLKQLCRCRYRHIVTRLGAFALP